MATALQQEVADAVIYTSQVVEIDGEKCLILPDELAYAIGDEVVIRPIGDELLMFHARDRIDLSGIAGQVSSLRPLRKSRRVRLRDRGRPNV